MTTSAKHVAVVRAKLKFTTREEFIQGFMPLIGRAGLFIRTKNPKEVGTVVRFEFKLADDTAIFVGEGTVRKQILPTPGASATPSGMIVALKRMNRASKEVLDEIVRRRVADQQSETPVLHHSTATPPAAVSAAEPDDFDAELPEPEASPEHEPEPEPVFAAAAEPSRPQFVPEPEPEHNPELAVEPENPFADLDVDGALGGGGLFGDGLESELDDIFAEAGMFSSDTDGFDFSAPADLGGSALPMINAGNIFEDPEPPEEEEEYRGGTIEMDESEFDDDDDDGDDGDLFSPAAPKAAKPVAPRPVAPRIAAPVLLAPPKPLPPPVLATRAPTPLPTPLPTFAPTPLPTPLPTFAPAPADDGLDDLLLAPEPEAALEPQTGFDDLLVAPEPEPEPEPEPDSAFDDFLVAPEPEPEPEPESNFDDFFVAPDSEPEAEPEYEADELDDVPEARLPPPPPPASHELDDVLHHLDDDEPMTNESAGLAEPSILSEPRIPVQQFASKIDDDGAGLDSLVSHAKLVDLPKIELNPLDAVSINNDDLPPPPKPTGFKSPSIDDLQAGKPRKKGLFNKLFGKE